MKKTELLFVLLICFAKPIFAIDYYQVGDRLFVWAQSGLTLREEPDAKAKAMMVIPHGSKIESLSSSMWSEKLVAIEIVKPNFTNDEDGTKIKTPALSIHGNWAKVRYKGKEGCVFDGYLSHMEVVRNDFLKFFKNHHKILEADTVVSYKQYFLFSKGYTFSRDAGDGACWFSESATFIGLSLEESILVALYKCNPEDDKTEVIVLKYKMIVEGEMYFIEFSPYGLNGTVQLRYSAGIADIRYDDHT